MKDIENRTTAWKYRGPLAIHAGTRWSDRGADFVPLQKAYAAWLGFTCWDGMYGGRSAMPIDPVGDPRDAELIDFAAVIGVVDLVDLHVAETGCCTSPWAEQQYTEHGGRVRRQLTHLVLANPRPVVPFRWLGKLGLWEFPDELIEDLP